jgi:hypothetical protein
MPRKLRFPMNEELRKYFQAVGKMGGAEGGRKTASNMTDEQRKARAKKAAEARWSKKRKKRS